MGEFTQCNTLRDTITHTLFTHAQRTVIYGVVIINRNVERANENEGFKMTALGIAFIRQPTSNERENTTAIILLLYNMLCFIVINDL